MCSEFSREKKERGKVNEKMKKDSRQEQQSLPGSWLKMCISPETSIQGTKAFKHTSQYGVQERSLLETDTVFTEQQKWMVCVTRTDGSAKVVSPLSFLPMFKMLCVLSWDKDQRRK